MTATMLLMTILPALPIEGTISIGGKTYNRFHTDDGLPVVAPPKADVITVLRAATPGQRQEVQRALWELGYYAPLDAADEQYVLPFLADADDDVFSATVESLEFSNAPKVWAYYQKLVGGTDAFRAARAASAFWKGKKERSPFDGLLVRMTGVADRLQFRRELAWHMTPYPGLEQAWLAAFVALLASDELWLRYNGINRLRAATGQTFGYRYRDLSNVGPLAEWKQWLAKNRETWKPVKREPQAIAGIGATFDHKATLPLVVAVNEGFPAAVGGVRPGDVIVSIDGDPTEGKVFREFANYEITGVADTPVRLSIRHKDGTVSDIALTRKPLVFPKKP